MSPLLLIILPSFLPSFLPFFLDLLASIPLLKKVYDEITEDEKSILTDACKAFVIRGVPVAVVMGEPQNMKITNMTDLKIAEHLVSAEDLKLD